MIDLSKFTPQQVAALKAWWAKQNQQPSKQG
jgi:hypothetical protein